MTVFFQHLNSAVNSVASEGKKKSATVGFPSVMRHQYFPFSNILTVLHFPEIHSLSHVYCAVGERILAFKRVTPEKLG